MKNRNFKLINKENKKLPQKISNTKQKTENIQLKHWHGIRLKIF